MSGKGSKPRPYSVPMTQFESEYERIFGVKKAVGICGSGDVSEEMAEWEANEGGNGSVVNHPYFAVTPVYEDEQSRPADKVQG